eukprot:3306558-Rhodomonas_salina.3
MQQLRQKLDRWMHRSTAIDGCQDAGSMIPGMNVTGDRRNPTSMGDHNLLLYLLRSWDGIAGRMTCAVITGHGVDMKTGPLIRHTSTPR